LPHKRVELSWTKFHSTPQTWRLPQPLAGTIWQRMAELFPWITMEITDKRREGKEHQKFIRNYVDDEKGWKICYRSNGWRFHDLSRRKDGEVGHVCQDIDSSHDQDSGDSCSWKVPGSTEA
jgi:hypothetical protein